MAKDSSPLQSLNVEAKQAIEQTVKQTSVGTIRMSEGAEIQQY